MDAKTIAGSLMGALSLLTLVLLITGLAKTLRKTMLAPAKQARITITATITVAAWMALTGTLAANGFFANFTALPPRVGQAVILPLPVIIFIARSKKFGAVLKATPAHWIIGLQAFRVLVELLLFKAFSNGLLPKQMTFEGGNFDIITGLLAIPVAIAIRKKYNPVLVRLYNIVGLLLLANVLVIAVLSMPTNLRVFMNEPANTLVAEFPFIYLPSVLVVIAYTLHIFSLRQISVLENERKANKLIATPTA